MLGTSGASHTKIIGTSRNNQGMIAPAGTKNKIGGGNQIHTALVNLGASSIGASLEDMGNLGAS